MIKAIRVQNFQRIDAALKLELAPVTVLVGENGSGKSSFLKAIHWAIRCATLADAGKVTLEQMDYVPSKDFLDLAHKLKLQNSSTGRKISVTLISDEDKETSISISAARNNAGVNISIQGSMALELTANDKPSTAYIPGIAGAAEEETILAVPIMHRKAASGEGGSVLRQIVLAYAVGGEGTGQQHQQLDELSKWVSLVLPETTFWIKFDRLRDRNIDLKFLTSDMKVQGQSHTVAWKSIDMAGTGFLQVVQIFAYLLYFRPKLLLIDEPDAHLHPGRQQRLIKALELASKNFPGTQIVISTHSPHLVRALSEDSCIHWLENGSAKANGDVVRQRMGWSILDKELIIFTEDGNTEKLQNILNQWPTLAQKCAIWPTFGKDSLPNGPKAVTLMNKMRIKILIHRDRDFMSDADAAAWSALKDYTAKNVPVWFTEGSDIESHFCKIEHVAKVLDVTADVAKEIFDDALASFDQGECMQYFSSGYNEAVNKLQADPDRNPIARWEALGGYSPATIKGKKFLTLLAKSCLTVLPEHGLGRKIGLRANLGKPAEGIPICSDLRQTIVSILK
ncbi:putative ATPase [Rhizobium sp. SG_E_25_P2]|uniref:ATP-dependent nuclease n=1 Tax=Rhizobium sp. SG_E_25_P2 TaxID=2879942 RepID=UPI00247523BC|nr:ATP-binding protein [Rhizobium sp. SG_E_25_P2]MDH6268290.1 putative ATPase [Rhizobium sp. SG_E_25_P2]